MSGIKAQNAIVQQGTSWEDLFGIDAGALTNLTRANFFVEVKGNDQYTWAECKYTGSGAITTSELANFPKGSTIDAVGLATPALYFKTGIAGVDTWKYQAVNT